MDGFGWKRARDDPPICPVRCALFTRAIPIPVPRQPRPASRALSQSGSPPGGVAPPLANATAAAGPQDPGRRLRYLQAVIHAMREPAAQVTRDRHQRIAASATPAIFSENTGSQSLSSPARDRGRRESERSSMRSSAPACCTICPTLTSACGRCARRWRGTGRCTSWSTRRMAARASTSRRSTAVCWESRE